ncbi:MAG: NADP-dependent malic enzyme [Deltaproteobacteria bacterium]|nr:NADP-dependent malic enzyme [Deltaproteobacteria bacterium]
MEDQFSLSIRLKNQGLIGVESKIPLKDSSALSLLYTPGVAAPCMEIAKDPIRSFDLTCRGNTIAIVSDGSAVYGLGSTGPESALAMLEGRSVFFKTFAGVDAFPLSLDTQDCDEIVEICLRLATNFGGIVLEDIAAPKCFTVERNLKRATRIPVFHNDQHGGAIAVYAALINALKIVDKKLDRVNVVISGAGAAGVGVARLLLAAGAKHITLCDRRGAIYRYRVEPTNWAKADVARKTNVPRRKGTLKEMLVGADVFIGLSAPGIVSRDMVKSMAKGAIVFAMANPIPEIMPNEALKAGAAVVGSGRSDFPNEINSAYVAPGIFRGMLDVRGVRLTEKMLLAAAEVVAGMVTEDKLNSSYIVPPIFDFHIAAKVARVVAQTAIESGDARLNVAPVEIEKKTKRIVYENEYTILPPPPPSKKNMSLNEESLDLHHRYQGVLEIKVKVPIKDEYILKSLYLPPSSSDASAYLSRHPEQVYDLTCKGNLVAIVSDGSAVLGLGNIGSRAAIPVMEGKAVLFKTFAGVEAFPICVCTQDVEEIIGIVKAISPTFGGINLEDISAPRCFEIEERLKKELEIPVFHDDQHGTAVVVLAGLINALKVVGKKLSEVRVIINGAGSAGIAVGKLLIIAGVQDIIFCDIHGIICEGQRKGLNPVQLRMSEVTNREHIKGDLAAAMKGSDVFIGLSAPGIVSRDMVKSMAKDPVVFAMANPIPEIMPDEAKKAGAAVIVTGRSDFPNQVNNSMVFPGIFRGALDVRARNINDRMKIAAANAIAGFIDDKDLNAEYIIPSTMNFKVPPQVAAAVARSAIETGEARIERDPDEVAAQTLVYLYEGHMRHLKG